MALTVQPMLVRKRFAEPDEVRPYAEDMGRVELVEIGGRMVGHSVCKPGWRWSKHVQPIAQTDSCEFLHLGMVLEGRMRITMDDGQQMEIGPGDVVEIPPGHDAEVIGDTTCELIDFGDITEFAKPPSS